jgi:hypothetical protein
LHKDSSFQCSLLRSVCNAGVLSVGANELTAFSPVHGQLYVRVGTGQWSSAVDVRTTGRSGVLTLKGVNGLRHEFAVSVTTAPGLFYRTKVVSFFPRVVLCNRTPQALTIKQGNPSRLALETGMVTVGPGEQCPIRFLHKDLPYTLHIMPGVHVSVVLSLSCR